MFSPGKFSYIHRRHNTSTTSLLIVFGLVFFFHLKNLWQFVWVFVIIGEASSYIISGSSLAEMIISKLYHPNKLHMISMIFV